MRELRFRRGFIGRAVLTGIVGLSSLAVVASAAAASSTVVVTPTNMQGWAFAPESGATGSGALVTGPETPPLGTGSANLVVNNPADGYILAVADYQGVMLSDIDALEYSTYRTSGGAVLAIALQFNIDYDLTDANTSFQGR